MNSHHSRRNFPYGPFTNREALFQRVAVRGSFAGEAEDVSRSPVAVARLITRLERRLGVRLINRTTRRLALTAEGETYLDRVPRAAKPLSCRQACNLLQRPESSCH